MDLPSLAFTELFPDKDATEFELILKYTDKFKPYNANIRYRGKRIQFNLSKRWKTVSKEIQIGLMQELLLKIFKKKKKTTNIDLYNIFMKNVHISVPKTKSDPILERSFMRVNEEYFFGQIEKPNLIWGKNSLRKLGSYEYGSDTISVSTIFIEHEELLDYIMYHELLHKKHKFYNKNGRNYHHTNKFREDEKEFHNSIEIERKISSIVRKRRLRKAFFRF